MANISEYSLNNTGAEVQRAINDSLINLPYQINQKVSVTDVLTKNNTTAYTPTLDYHPATKAYADSLRPNITVGITTTGEAGTQASVVNSGTSQDAILNFTIPQGIQGVQGVQGVKGDTGDSGVYIGTQTPTDPDVNVWINPSGGDDVLVTEQYVDTAIQNAITTVLESEY